MKHPATTFASLLTLLSVTLISSAALAQTVYTPMRIASGYNVDVIAEGNHTGGPNGVIASTNSTIDRGNSSVRYCIADSSFVSSTGARPTGTLPTIIRSISTMGLVYRRAPAAGPNALRLDLVNGVNSGTLVFANPTPCSIIKVLATEGNGSTYADKVFTLNFADGTTQVSAGTVVPDWFSNAVNQITVPAFHVGSRVNRPDDTIDNQGSNPTLFEVNIPINPANTGKLVQSIRVSKTIAPGESNFTFTDPVLNIFGVSVVQSCILPVGTLTAGAPTTVCPGTAVPLTVALSGGTPGVTGQWQSSTTSPTAGFTDVPGITGPTFTPSPLVTTHYRYQTICSASFRSPVGPLTITVELPNPRVSYDAAAYCRTGKSAAPTATPAGGTFSAPVGLVLDPATGIIDLEASTPGSYAVQYAIPAPCFTKSTTAVTVKSDVPPTFPNVLTPNGDGLNDGLVFKFPNPDVSGFNLQVYNRWGSRIWEGTDPTRGWAAEKAGPGVYYYQVDYTDCAGKAQHYKGTVEVMK